MRDKNKKNSSQTETWKVWIDRDLCIGAASCIAIAPNAFSLDSESKAVVLGTKDKEQKTNIMDAAQACPVAAIFIEEIKTGKRIFPK